MKTLLKSIAFVMIFTISMTVSAQKTDKTTARAEKDVVEMVEVMKLSPEQKSKIIELKKELYTAKDKAKMELKDKPNEFKSAMKESSKKYDAAFSAVCTAEQLKLWKTYTDSKKAK